MEHKVWSLDFQNTLSALGFLVCQPSTIFNEWKLILVNTIYLLFDLKNIYFTSIYFSLIYILFLIFDPLAFCFFNFLLLFAAFDSFLHSIFSLFLFFFCFKIVFILYLFIFRFFFVFFLLFKFILFYLCFFLSYFAFLFVKLLLLRPEYT